MQDINDLRISRNMKYESLYWALGFEEVEKNVYLKKYNNYNILIYADRGEVKTFSKINIVNGDSLLLNSHKSFVILECIDKLLEMGYLPEEIIVDLDNEYDIYLNGIYIKCFEWGKLENLNIISKQNKFVAINYESRLVSGLIERKSIIKGLDNKIYDFGFFEANQKQTEYKFYNLVEIKHNDFIIKNGKIIKYLGDNEIVKIPEGIKALDSCLFWDNQNIKEVILPESLVSLGGDTFYNCSNLEKIIIPKNVIEMGNNPFAGCPKLNIINKSSKFIYEEDTLYSSGYKKIIYHKIDSKITNYDIKYGTKIIGKHSFYLCDSLLNITIPNTVIKLENNPFSGCSKLNLINNSDNYIIKDDVIYDKYIESVIGSLNKINNKHLKLLNVKRICRNAFWNCKGIYEIVLPETLIEIGYNPFVGCDNIKFINESPNFKVEDGILYNYNQNKIICCPPNAAVENMHIKDSVVTLERGAFSGCKNIKNINLHNVSIISKSCFTNCISIEKIYCSDLITYIGEWAFAHDTNLKELSVYKDCIIDRNATLNTNTKIMKREERTNYLIESDNIYTLESMLSSYQNKVKSILIDPPYNSNVDYIEYKDNFGNDYYNYINKRLIIASMLLKDDGFMVINIDKGGLKIIKDICINIFSKTNVKVYKWEKLNPFFDKNKEIKPGKAKVKFEYIIICKKNQKTILNQIEQPYIEDNILKYKYTELPQVFSCFGTTSSAKDELKEIFGTREYFSTPKPLKLIMELIRATTKKNDLILDFFAGSGTTAVACTKLNASDGGNRKFILVSNSESNICENVTLKRLKKEQINFRFIN